MFKLKGLENFLIEDLIRFKLKANKELLKRRLHKLLLQILLFLSMSCLAMGSLVGDLPVSACRRVTGLRAVRPEVKSAPVHPCLK